MSAGVAITLRAKLALVDEQDVVDAGRTLLNDGLIEAWQLAESEPELVPCPEPFTDDTSLRHYWFRWTPAGERAWRDAHDAHDAYWDPILPAVEHETAAYLCRGPCQERARRCCRVSVESVGRCVSAVGGVGVVRAGARAYLGPRSAHAAGR